MLTGSIQGLHLVGRITLDHGDTIVTEAPTFMGALAAWEHQQPRFLTIPVDDHGMRMDALAARACRGPISTPVHVPAADISESDGRLDESRTPPPGARDCHEHDLLIIEDDPYGEFWFDEESGSIPPIRSLPGAEERVVYLGTFSKILAPGFRLAYAVAPPEMVEQLLRAKRGIDFHSDGCCNRRWCA